MRDYCSKRRSKRLGLKMCAKQNNKSMMISRLVKISRLKAKYRKLNMAERTWKENGDNGGIGLPVAMFGISTNGDHLIT